MLRWLINKRLDSAEKKLGGPVDYLRHIARVSLPAFFKFARFTPVASCTRVKVALDKGL